MSSTLRDRIGPGRVTDHIGTAVRVNRYVADRQTLAQLQEPAIGDEVALLGLPQEVEVQARGDGERHRADMRQDRHVEGEIRQGHHGRPRDRSARSDMTVVVGHPHPGRERSDLIHEIGLPSDVDLRELLVEERRELVSGHDGMVRCHESAMLIELPCPIPYVPFMNHDNYPNDYIRGILNSVKTIALVGASQNPARPSWIVTKYLLERGYDVIPINPGLAGTELLGKTVYASLKDVPVPIDMVEVFRNSEAAGPITDEALALDPLPKVLWMQLSVRNDDAAAKAEAKGLKVVMDRCPKIEFGRLSGEISWQGVNSRMISAKKPVLSGKGFQKLSLNRP